MNNKTPYLNQLSEFFRELDSKHLKIKDLPDDLYKYFRELLLKAKRQSGLSQKELAMIVTYRRFNPPNLD